MSTVREWGDVKKEAPKSGKHVHIGLVYELCHDKSAELPDGDPKHKFQGRVAI